MVPDVHNMSKDVEIWICERGKRSEGGGRVKKERRE
jgi:hypothetical protein